MRDQMFRIILGMFFLGIALWSTFVREMALGELLIVYVFGILLLVRALPLSVWKRWEVETCPPQR